MLLLLLYAGSGQFFNWVEIGNVSQVDNSSDNFCFAYGPGEDLKTVWPGGKG